MSKSTLRKPSTPKASNVVDRFLQLTPEAQAKAIAEMIARGQIKLPAVTAAPTVPTVGGFKTSYVGRKTQKARAPEGGVQIVPEVNSDNEVLIEERKPGRPTVNFLVVNDQGESARPVPELDALIREHCGTAQNWGWAPTQNFRGNPNFPKLKDHKGRRYMPVSGFEAMLAEWNAIVPQKYISPSEE